MSGIRKIVINTSRSEFSLSEEASQEYIRMTNLSERDCLDVIISRDDPVLVDIIERLGDKANGTDCMLLVVEIPGDVIWELSERNGIERIEEQHRYWPV